MAATFTANDVLAVPGVKDTGTLRNALSTRFGCDKAAVSRRLAELCTRGELACVVVGTLKCYVDPAKPVTPQELTGFFAAAAAAPAPTAAAPAAREEEKEVWIPLRVHANRDELTLVEEDNFALRRVEPLGEGDYLVFMEARGLTALLKEKKEDGALFYSASGAFFM